jgi:hypothetical protein
MPEGDWTATVKFSSEFPLGNEGVGLALFQDKDHWTAAMLIAVASPNWSHRLEVDLKRKSLDEVLLSPGQLPGANNGGDWKKFLSDNKLSHQPIYLRLQRAGHDFIVSSRLETAGPDAWVTLNKIASLHLQAASSLGSCKRARVQVKRKRL